MKIGRRIKWGRYGIQLLIATGVLGGAWLLYQTQGGAILELYSWLGRALESESPALLQERLTNARIVELEQRLAESEKQNQQLKGLLGDFEKQSQSVISAPIIGRSPDAWWQEIILGRGSQDGVEVGFVVTGIGGLVGRVINVTPHSSQVLLVSDPTSRLGVTVSRSRSMGLIQGQGSKIALMRFFEKVPDVRPGDGISTSSVSRLFPSGLPIGRVKSVNLEKGPAPEATIELTAPIEHLEWVIIHPFKSKL